MYSQPKQSTVKQSRMAGQFTAPDCNTVAVLDRDHATALRKHRGTWYWLDSNSENPIPLPSNSATWERVKGSLLVLCGLSIKHMGEYLDKSGNLRYNYAVSKAQSYWQCRKYYIPNAGTAPLKGMRTQPLPPTITLVWKSLMYCT